MTTVGIRELKQNASRVIASVVDGAEITVTDHGRAVARIVPLCTDRLQALRTDGRLRPPKLSISDLGPAAAHDASLSLGLAESRGEERY